MKKLFYLILLFTLSISFYCNSQDIYMSKYKIISSKTEKDNKSKFENLFLNNMIYNFYSDYDICYLYETETLNTDGINSKVLGDENLFVDYNNQLVTYNLSKNDFYTFKKINFVKLVKSEVKILGMETTKYISKDKNFIIYTTKNLPWHVQPCLICFNQFSESIVKFENLKTKNGFELIEFKKIKINSTFEDFKKKLKSIKKVNKKSIPSPFFQF